MGLDVGSNGSVLHSLRASDGRMSSPLAFQKLFSIRKMTRVLKIHARVTTKTSGALPRASHRNELGLRVRQDAPGTLGARSRLSWTLPRKRTSSYASPRSCREPRHR